MSVYGILGISAKAEDPEMSETLTMSAKERQRLQVLGHLKHGKTTVAKAAAVRRHAGTPERLLEFAGRRAGLPGFWH